MNGDRLDMSTFPDTDPDTVAPPDVLLGLHLLLQGLPAGESLLAHDFQLMLSIAVSPPDLVESSVAGFDDQHDAGAHDIDAGHGEADPSPPGGTDPTDDGSHDSPYEHYEPHGNDDLHDHGSDDVTGDASDFFDDFGP